MITEINKIYRILFLVELVYIKNNLWTIVHGQGGNVLIGEVSRKLGLSRDTIRYYEKRGLLKVTRSEGTNSYKNYTEANMRTLLQITKCKSFGFTLQEISEILELVGEDEANCGVMRQKVKNKIDMIDQKIEALKELKNSILGNVDSAKGECDLEANKNCHALFN